jgi:hypothetical protein
LANTERKEEKIMAQEILIPVRRDEELEEISQLEQSRLVEEFRWYAEEVGSIVRYLFWACRNGPVLLGDSWVIALFK